MRKRLGRILAVTLSASLVLGSVPFWGESKVSAENGSFRAGDNLVQLNSSSESMLTAAASKPSAPRNFKVTTDETSLTVSWDSVDEATEYKVMVDGQVVYNGPDLAYTYTGLTPDTYYVVTLNAVNAEGESGQQFQTVKTKDPDKMPAPTGLIAETTHNSATISWNAVEGATEYWVMVNNNQVYNGPNLTVTAENLGSDRPYTVYVRAVKYTETSIEEGEQASMQIVTKPKPMEVPGQPTVVSTEAGNVKIAWPASNGAVTYKIQRNGVNIGSVANLEYTDTTAVEGETYQYTVKSVNGSNTSAASPSVTVTVTANPETPVFLDVPLHLEATPKETSIKLTWDPVEGATNYIIRQAQAIIYDGPLTTFTHTDLPSGATYEYFVYASNGTIESGPAIASATTLVAHLPYPANFRVTDLQYNNIRLEWDAVEGADEYLITRNGMSIGIPMGTWWSEDGDDIAPGATYTYRVAAYKGAMMGKEAVIIVTIPNEPIEGEAPTGDLVVKANRVSHNRVGLSWSTVTGATHYDVYRDGNYKVWSGSLNAVNDNNVGPKETHTYTVVAGNQWGTLSSNVITITTPATPQSIMVTPSEPMEGTITFNYKVIDGAVMYTERNPQTKAVPLGDGTYQVTYYNAATSESRDFGIQTPVNGMLKFVETGVEPGKKYQYDITAVVLKANGTEEVVAHEQVSVDTPADGSGATVPGTTPGGDTGTTTPPSTGGNNGGSTGGNGNNGGSTGGSTTTPTGDNQGSVPGTVVDPTEGEGSTDDKGTEVENNTTFSDISGNFAEKAIKHLTAAGILEGYADGTFGPNQKVTRAEFAIMTTRAMGYKNSSSNVQAFKDLNEKAWYAEELLAALDAGVTKGFTDGTLRPNVSILREQAAVMIANILEKNNFKTSVGEKNFMDDTEIAAWAQSSVMLLKSNRIVEGQNNSFYPKREITRAEAAVMIDRMLNVLNN